MHVVFQLRVEQQLGAKISESYLSVVDLAPSDGDQDLSLKNLKKVLIGLSKPPFARDYIPFDGAKLTKLLKINLMANCFCLLILCLTPHDRDFEKNM